MQEWKALQKAVDAATGAVKAAGGQQEEEEDDGDDGYETCPDGPAI